MFSPTRLAVLLLIAFAAVHFYGLTRTGMLGPDEPRYAAIGREMAASGDWVTPRLWGVPWFEKPPLVYWMTAAATRLGLGTEAAPRVPVAVLGIGFVLFFYLFVRSEFGPAEALYTTAVLGTSTAWLTYSYVAVMDVPLSTFFCAAWLLTFSWIRDGEGSIQRALAIGSLLGLAVLAKGLVPLVLFAPVAWPMRRHFGKLVWIAVACLVVAAPWYALCTIRNGTPFLQEFFLRHHFSRFSSDELQHVRPFWFYIPVLLGAVFPWTPLFGLLRPRLFRDHRLRFTGLWLLFALLFFSAARNKLPGYLLPLMPGLALVVGLALAWARRARWSLFLSALALAAVPLIAAILPDALDVGLSRSTIRSFDTRWMVLFVIASSVPLILAFKTLRNEALVATALIAVAAFVYVKYTALPQTDRIRPFYSQHQNWLDRVCLQDVDRDSQYALQYYAERGFPVCDADFTGPKIMGVGSRLILLD